MLVKNQSVSCHYFLPGIWLPSEHNLHWPVPDYVDMINMFHCIMCHIITLAASILLLPFVQDYPGEPVPAETFTHSNLSWSSIVIYLLPPSTTIHSIRPVQFTCLTVFLHNLCPSPRWSTSWSGIHSSKWKAAIWCLSICLWLPWQCITTSAASMQQRPRANTPAVWY